MASPERIEAARRGAQQWGTIKNVEDQVFVEGFGDAKRFEKVKKDGKLLQLLEKDEYPFGVSGWWAREVKNANKDQIQHKAFVAPGGIPVDIYWIPSDELWKVEVDAEGFEFETFTSPEAAKAYGFKLAKKILEERD